MPMFRFFTFMHCFLEFTGSYIQTKSGDEKYHWGDGKRGSVERQSVERGSASQALILTNPKVAGLSIRCSNPVGVACL